MTGDVEATELVPPKLVPMLASLATNDVRLVHSPLPDLAATWYSHGGCWSLALALHDETRLPIELYYLSGRPTHAYVVDDETAIDYRGRNPLRLLRRGAQKTERVDRERLLDRLRKINAEIDVLVSNDEVVEAAARTARLLLNLSGV